MGLFINKSNLGLIWKETPNSRLFINISNLGLIWEETPNLGFMVTNFFILFLIWSDLLSEVRSFCCNCGNYPMVPWGLLWNYY